MRIDLRYPIAIAAFYLPGVLFLIFARLIGYGFHEVWHAIAVGGGIAGLIASGITAGFLFDYSSHPIWWGSSRKREGEE